MGLYSQVGSADSNSHFYVHAFNADPFLVFHSDYSGESFQGPDVWDRIGLARAYRAKLADPNTAYVYNGARAGYKDPAKDRVHVLYLPYKDVVLPIAANNYYQASDWVGIRGGVEFVVFSSLAAVGAAGFVSAEISAMVEGGSSTASLGATQASLISSFGSAAGQVTGDQRVAIAGKIVGTLSGDFSVTDGGGFAFDPAAVTTGQIASLAGSVAQLAAGKPSRPGAAVSAPAKVVPGATSVSATPLQTTVPDPADIAVGTVSGQNATAASHGIGLLVLVGVAGLAILK